MSANEAQVHELVLDLTNPEKVSNCALSSLVVLGNNSPSF